MFCARVCQSRQALALDAVDPGFGQIVGDSYKGLAVSQLGPHKSLAFSPLVRNR